MLLSVLVSRIFSHSGVISQKLNGVCCFFLYSEFFHQRDRYPLFLFIRYPNTITILVDYGSSQFCDLRSFCHLELARCLLTSQNFLKSWFLLSKDLEVCFITLDGQYQAHLVECSLRMEAFAHDKILAFSFIFPEFNLFSV